jgi:biopolymer transport protein ExbD
MKFARNARIFRGRLDATPIASVFFLLAIFILLGSLLYTPGIRVGVELPRADDLPGTDRPTLSVAMDKDGRYYFDNQQVGEQELTNRLHAAAQQSSEPLTLVIHADKQAAYEKVICLAMLARDAGIPDTLLATLPRVLSP